MTRLEANKEILQRILNYMERNPDLRFNQALISLGLSAETYDFETGNRYNHIDFYEESTTTLDKLRGKGI